MLAKSAGAAAAAARPGLLDDPLLPCRREPDLWFSDHPSGVESAKRRCRGCPLLEECLAGALTRGEPWGVWGGKLLVDGVVVARKRGRGRPRKDQAAA